MMTTN